MTALACMLAFELGLVGLTLAWLNARDRRRERATAIVLAARPRSLRGALTVHARAPLLSSRVTVVLELSDFDGTDVWAAVRPLARALPPHVSLVIGTSVDRVLPVTLSVEAAARRYA